MHLVQSPLLFIIHVLLQLNNLFIFVVYYTYIRSYSYVL